MRNKSSDSHPRHSGISVECLESRIAPATIFVGDPTRNDSEYKEGVGFGAAGTADDPTFATPFVDTADPANAADPIVQVLGANAGVFYVKLTTGDKMVIFGGSAGGGGGYTDFISGPGGSPLK